MRIGFLIDFGLKNRGEKAFFTTVLIIGPKESIAQLGSNELAVQAGDIADADALGALGLAGTGVGAVSESQLIHLGEHGLGATGSLYLTLRKQSQLANLGTYKQHS